MGKKGDNNKMKKIYICVCVFVCERETETEREREREKKDMVRYESSPHDRNHR